MYFLCHVDDLYLIRRNHCNKTKSVWRTSAMPQKSLQRVSRVYFRACNAAYYNDFFLVNPLLMHQILRCLTRTNWFNVVDNQQAPLQWNSIEITDCCEFTESVVILDNIINEIGVRLPNVQLRSLWLIDANYQHNNLVLKLTRLLRQISIKAVVTKHAQHLAILCAGCRRT